MKAFTNLSDYENTLTFQDFLLDDDNDEKNSDLKNSILKLH